MSATSFLTSSSVSTLRIVGIATLCLALAGVTACTPGDGPDGAAPEDSPSESATAVAASDDVNEERDPAPADADEESGDAPADANEESGDDPAEEDPVDYDEDAGLELESHEYPDDPEPAEGIVSTLCNLNGEYVRSLRAESTDGEPVVDDNLRLSVLSMSDNLMLWESIVSHYPEYESAIEAAWLVRNHWDAALISNENGDDAEARLDMIAADEIIDDLPTEGLINEIECSN